MVALKSRYHRQILIRQYDKLIPDAADPAIHAWCCLAALLMLPGLRGCIGYCAMNTAASRASESLNGVLPSEFSWVRSEPAISFSVTATQCVSIVCHLISITTEVISSPLPMYRLSTSGSMKRGWSFGICQAIYCLKLPMALYAVFQAKNFGCWCQFIRSESVSAMKILR